MVICFSNRDRNNRFTTEYDSIQVFQEENPYANVWFAFNEKDDVSSANIVNEKCPICGGYIRSGRINYYCSEYKNRCKINIPFAICEKKLSQAQLKMLISLKRTNIIKGFISKSGKPFDASLIINDESNTEFVFDNNHKRAKK